MNTTRAKLGASFGWLNTTQFLGALNDNVFKLLIILFLIGHASMKPASTTALAGAVFVIPFLLFSAFAGKLADRFSKRNIVIWTKFAEVAIMTVGCIAFIFKSPTALYGVLSMMAAQSAFFNPSKYGIVPELVKPEQLSHANGLLEALTYLAIVIGTALGPFLVKLTSEHYVLLALICVALAAAGTTVSLRIQHTPPAGIRKPASIFFLRDIWRTLRDIRPDKNLSLAVIASAYFLLIGGFIYSNLIPYGITHLGLDSTQSGYLFAVAAIGIGAGAFWAGRLSGRNVEFGIIPLGAIGLTLSSIGLGLAPSALAYILALVFLTGLSAGLFVVPIHAFIQLRSPRQKRGEILAASNFLGWVGVLIASVSIYCFSTLWGMSAAQVFMVLGLMTLLPTIITIILLPDFFVRFVCILVTRLCYRIKVTGLENIPPDKGALLICNHVSRVDALLLAATQQRRIRFIMDRNFYNAPLLRPICRLMKAIPISAKDPPKKIVASLKQARAAMNDGSLICIFAEGVITRNGLLRRFRAGFEKITKGTDCPIIPAYIGGAWGSIFSYYYGKLLSTLPKKFPYPISIHFGKPMPADSTASRIRQKVTELACEYFDNLKSPRRSLAHQFVKTAHKNWRRRCICDSMDKRLNYGQTLTAAIALAEKIDNLTNSQPKIGIMLPPSAPAALTNLATTLLKLRNRSTTQTLRHRTMRPQMYHHLAKLYAKSPNPGRPARPCLS